MVISALPPYLSGVVTSTLNLAEELSKGHNITILAGGPDRKKHHQRINNNLEHILLPTTNIKIKGNLRVPFPNLKMIEEIVAKDKPDIIHLHDASPLSFSSLSVAKKLSIPVVVSHHFTAELILKSLVISQVVSNRLSKSLTTRQLIYRLVNSFYNQCQLVTVPSPAIVDQLKKSGLKAPVIYVPNGIKTSLFQRRQTARTVLRRYQIQQKQIILFVGRMDLDKDLELLVKAFSLILPLNPQVGLVFVGTGNQKKKLIRLAKKLQLEKQVYFLGQIDNRSSHLSYLYNAAHVFVNPSIIENQGVVFLEAMAARIPIVAINTPAVAQVIEHNKNGLLTKPNSPDGLAVAIQKLLSDNKLHRTIVEQNRSKSKKFDISSTSKQYLKAYRSL